MSTRPDPTPNDTSRLEHTSRVLADWVPSRGPSFEGIRIVGPRWGTRSHELRDMLTRMGIPHGWYQAETAAGRQLLEEAGEDGSRLPVVLFHSGQVFVDPSNAELAEALGFGTRPAADSYDLVIVGAGPAGRAGAVYAASEGLDTLVVEPQVSDWVVARALKRETGARGLRAALAPVLERAAYEHFGQPTAPTVRLALEGEQVRAIAE